MKVEEVEKGKEVKEENTRVAAFFDLDGTLLSLPSLERRFLRVLRYRREIPVKNYSLWLREAMRLLPRGITVRHANKMYLNGIEIFGADNTENRWLVPRFFEEGVDRVVCHAMLGHVIVIVSGTLEPLAKNAARMLQAQLAARGFPAKIRVCATRLEESDGRWTGRIVGEGMFGEAKARAVRKLATEMQWDLTQCWAYGDSSNDRPMLETVGKPVAVNPSLKLACAARICGWAILRWKQKKESPRKAQSPQETQSEEREARNQDEEARQSLLREDLRVIRERVLQMVRWI